MTDVATADHYVELTDPNTLRLERLLPGPVERIWDYLVKGDLRRKWFAAGDIPMEVGAPFELVWRNDELTDPPGQRPAGSSEESRMQSRVLELEPLRKIVIAWGTAGGSVEFGLTPQGDQILLTIVHRGVTDRASALNFGPGWHAHVDILHALLTGATPKPFWGEIARLRIDYAERLSA